MGLQLVDSQMKVKDYMNLLKRASLRDEGQCLCGDHWVFMQDNAPVHTARVTMKFLHCQKIRKWTGQPILHL